MFEVFCKHLDQLVSLTIVGFRVVPCPAWIQQDVSNTRNRHGNVKAEVWIFAVLYPGERPFQCCGQQRARCFDRHAAACAISAPSPAGVYQPAGCAMRRDLLAEKVPVDFGATRHEGRTKAGRECRLGFSHATFGTGNLGGEARQEVVHGLRRGQTRDRGKNTEGITG